MRDSWGRAVGDYCQWLKAGGYPATTMGLRRMQLMRFAADIGEGPWEVSGAQITAWLAAHEWAPETRRSHRGTLGNFFSWAVRSGRVAADPMLDVPRARPGHHVARPAPEGAVDEALAGADERVRLMIELAARQGLRRGEIAQVRGEDVTRTSLGWSLLVRGKGQRERVIPVESRLAQQIVERAGEDGGWVFPGRVEGHLSPARVGELVAARLPGAWTTHTLRHRFATRAYAGSRDLIAVQALLGHSKPETTLRYVELPDDAMRAALAHAA